MVNIEQSPSVSLGEPSLLTANHAVTIDHAGTIGISCSFQSLTVGRGFAIISLEGRGRANNFLPEVEVDKLSYQ